MRPKAPKAETEFLSAAIQPAVLALANPALLDDFIAFAVQNGSDRLAFPGRLAKVLRGDTPTAYMTAVMLEWLRIRQLSRQE